MTHFIISFPYQRACIGINEDRERPQNSGPVTTAVGPNAWALEIGAVKPRAEKSIPVCPQCKTGRRFGFEYYGLLWNLLYMVSFIVICAE